MSVKKINQVRPTFLLIVSLLLTTTACKDDAPTLTEAEQVTKLLTNGMWSLSSVLIDDTQADDLFENFSLTFTKTGYTTTGTTPVWPRTGAWNFTNPDEPDQFIRDDEVKVDIISLSKNSLTLELNWTKETIVGGRLQSIKGKHVFVLIH